MTKPMVTENETGALIAEAQAGDRRAFDELVRRYQPRLKTWILSRMGSAVLLRLAADDVLQEAFTRAFESVEKFIYRGEESFYNWLRNIAEHVIWNASQKKGRHQLRLMREVPATAASPSRQFRRNERFDRLEKALHGLSPDYKQAIILARLEGLQVKQIARIMNKSPNAVKKLLARAMIELRRSFGDTESLHLPDRELGGEEDGHEA